MAFGNTSRRAMNYACSRRALTAGLAGLGLALAATPALAQNAPVNINLGQVTASGQNGLADDAGATAPGSAASVAPGRTPFTATQPSSLVSRSFIANNVAPTGNYDDVIKFEPSVSNIEPDGPGLQESKTLSIRGFQDGQYNILYDGIPLAGAPTDFHHESAVYFTSNDLGGVEIDRGPGTAATIGDATFGGTLALVSKDPSAAANGTLYGAYGSYNTYQVGADLDTGAIASANGASAVIDVQHDASDGYLTYSGDRRLNFFGKVLIPLNANTLLTFEAMHNEGFQYTPSGATLAQIKEFGPDFGNNDNPKSQAFYQYQQNKYSTDFEYVGLSTVLPFGITVDNKTYTDALYHDTYEATDSSGLTANLKGKYYLDGSRTATTLVNAVPGKAGLQDYRAFGDVARFSKEIVPGYVKLNFGGWYDHTANSYSSESVDMSAGGATYSKTLGGSPSSYDLSDFADTIQPYAEFVVTPLPGLTLTPGVKYTYFSRTDDAAINKSTKKPSDQSADYDDYQPSFEARYVPVVGLSVYAQAAKGFQAPPLSAFFTQTVNPLKPEQTWNYQAGTVYQTHDTSLSADVYYIDFSNFIQSNAELVDGASETVYSNGGGVIYKGVELEGTQKIFGPVSLYGNFTLNSAVYTNGSATVAQTPRRTMAAGMIVQQGPFYGSIIGKIIGPQYGEDTAGGAGAPVDEYPVKSYSNVDLAFGYTLPVMHADKVKVKVNINNIFNDTGIAQFSGVAGDGVTPVYFTNPGRSAFVSLALTF
jgi:iron complex outermembrane receptor protein